MGEIVNLRRVKKQREREAAAREAETNRARHGRTKAEILTATLATEQTRRALDQAKLED